MQGFFKVFAQGGGGGGAKSDRMDYGGGGGGSSSTHPHLRARHMGLGGMLPRKILIFGPLIRGN